MTLYSGDAGGVFSVSGGGGGGGCCSSLGRVALMFITVLSTSFTIGTLIIAGSALYNVYNPEQYSVDHRGLVQLWLLVAASCIAVATNACGFIGALLRIRCMLLGYALVTGMVVGGQLLVNHLQQRAAQRRPNIDRLHINDDPQSVWTVEMNAYTAKVLKRVKSEPGDDSRLTVDRINRTVSELRAQLAPNASNVAESALRTVNTIQSLFKCCGKGGVDDFIALNLTIPESCCDAATRCNATLRRRPWLDLPRARQMAHRQPCGPFLHAAHGFVVAVITWVSYVVAGSQLCGVVIALMLALCCL